MAGRRRSTVLYRPSDQQRELEPIVRAAIGPESYRSSYRRDYARLIHCAAFRRLQGKTQVFPGEESDFFRNRLTHSLEVAQIAKSIAIRLNRIHDFFRRNSINEEIVELAGLAHDLGHPPFGHNGEAALDACMRAVGGFEGNAQTLRIIGRLEKKEARDALPVGIDEDGIDHRLGLNLTYRSMASVLKYDRMIPIVRNPTDGVVKGYYSSEADLVRRIKQNTEPSHADSGNFKTIECSIMDIADDIAYSTYDLEDTFKAGFLTPLSIVSLDDVDLYKRVAAKAARACGQEVNLEDVAEIFVDIFRDLFNVDEEVRNLIITNPKEVMYFVAKYSNASSQIADYGYLRTGFTADLVSEFIAGISVNVNEEAPAMSSAFLDSNTKLKVEVLKNFTFEATIMSPRLRISEQRGYEIVAKTFEKLDSPNGYLLLPEDFREHHQRFRDVAQKKRVICDFIAGMMDRYAVEFYGRLFSESPQSIFKPY